MSRLPAHHRALVGTARDGPDPYGPVDTGRVPDGEGQIREPAPKVHYCGFHVRDRLGTVALDAELVLHEVGRYQLIHDGEVASTECLVQQPDEHVNVVRVLHHVRVHSLDRPPQLVPCAGWCAQTQLTDAGPRRPPNRTGGHGALARRDAGLHPAMSSGW